MKNIPLFQKHTNKNKKYAIVDDIDFGELSKYAWYFNINGYARRFLTPEENKNRKDRKQISMHRQILNAPSGYDVDHINGNTLDNRRSNIRLCTKSQNMRNTKPYKNNKSGYKGVYFYSKINKYRVIINRENIGVYKNITDAIAAYNRRAIELYGEFARLNKII